MHSTLPPYRRGLAAVGALLAVSSAVALAPGSAQAAPDTVAPPQAAAGWLASQLVDGDHIEVTIDLDGNGQITDDERFPDYGLTADTVIALAAAGVGGDASAAATDYLETNIELYVGDADTDDDGVDDPEGEYYAGALAKALLLADVTGRDATDFGGVDLVSRLLATQTPSGRFSDISQYGDFSNNIGQSLAVIALQRTDQRLLTGNATDYLRAQQCLDGGAQDGNVAISPDQDPCAADSTSIDTTAFAFQAFESLDDGLPVTRAREFLVRSQGPDGGFADQGIVNSNSTGLAAQVLTFGESGAAGDAAVQWLLDHQLGCSAPADQQGAIAFTDGPDGLPLFDDRALRATTQAVPGLADVLLLSVSSAGSTPAAPRLDCQSPTQTPTPTPTATPTATPTDPGPTGSPTPTQPPPTAGPTSTGPGLPATGTAIGPMLGLAGGSLLLGGGLLLAGRRRHGAHR